MEGEIWRRSETTELGEVEEVVAGCRGDGDGGGCGCAGDEDAARFVGEGTSERRRKERVKGPWSQDEDVVLSDLVEKFGPRNWILIALSIPGRSGKSCRLRWCNQLDPSLKGNPFTEVEDQAIITAHAIHDNKWSVIAKLLPGRTDAIKNHCNAALRRQCMDVENLTMNIGTGNLVLEDSGFNRTMNTIASSEETLSSGGGGHVTTPLVSSDGKEATSIEMCEEQCADKTNEEGISRQEGNVPPTLFRPVAQLSSFSAYNHMEGWSSSPHIQEQNKFQSCKQDTAMLRLLEGAYSERFVPQNCGRGCCSNFQKTSLLGPEFVDYLDRKTHFLVLVLFDVTVPFKAGSRLTPCRVKREDNNQTAHVETVSVDENTLEQDLKTAIQEENYVKAAKIRDRLKELQQDNKAYVLSANAQFYQAFRHGDLAEMQSLWSKSGKPCCVHPGAKGITGYVNVMESWEVVWMNYEFPLQIELKDVEAHVRGEIGYVTCMEFVKTKGSSSWGAQFVSNVFERIDGQWFICIHHASPVDI